MSTISRTLAAALVTAAVACAPAPATDTDSATIESAVTDLPRSVTPEPGEVHLTNMRQLTDGGENAEAYFSADGKRIIFQSTRDGRSCDQQYIMNVDGTDVHQISNGEGKTTCGFFYNGDQRVFFASTQAAEKSCPAPLDPSKGYVWGIDPYDIYTANPDGSDLQRLTNYDTYTAEAILSPDGKKIVFTSLKDGDLDIYTMNIDGSDVRQLTTALGYDGGPWWSPDGTQIVYRAYHPTDPAELKEYQDLLEQRMIRPNKMELFVMNADGSDQRQITTLGGANFGPNWTPDGKQLIFSSNYKNPRSGNFDLYVINLDGTGLEQITTHDTFDGFPMFSPDGTKIIWASNRNAKEEGSTNVFVADWKK